MTDCDMRNKTYQFMPSDVKPLFGFGYGLSYSELQYDGLQGQGPCGVQLDELGPYPTVLFNVTLSNRGRFNGQEVSSSTSVGLVLCRWISGSSVYHDYS